MNPAGLAQRAATIEGHLTARRGPGDPGFANAGITVASGGLAFGYQRDRRSDGRRAATFAVGLGLGDDVFSAGAVRRWYRAAGSSSSWDLGLRFRPQPLVALALVWHDLGEPRIRDTTVQTTLVPAASLSIGRVMVGVEWEFVTERFGTSEVRAGGRVSLGYGLALALRGDFSARLASRRLVIMGEWDGRGARGAAFSAGQRGQAFDEVGVFAAVTSRPLAQRGLR